MKIFENSSSKRTRRKTKKVDQKELDAIGRDKLLKLHPMAFSLLALKANEDRPNEWIVTTFDAVNNRAHHLSEKWINSINSWVDRIIKDMSLDEPEIAAGERTELGPFKIFKVVPPKDNVEYPTPAILSIDDRGWKWYFKTSKAYSFKEGESICLTATISSHKEGITFLKRPSKIRVADNEVGIFK